MPIEVTMPRLSDTMEQGTIVAWNVKEGDEVSAGDALGDIETDKATMELQTFDDGVVASILLEEGKAVGVGELILVLAEEDEDPADVKRQFADGASKSSGEATQEAASSSAGSDSASSASSVTAVEEAPASSNGASSNGSGNGRIFASPLAKKIAQERGIDLSTIQGSGPSGRIVKKDVEDAGQTSAPAPMETSTPGIAAPTVAAPAPAQSQLSDEHVSLTNMRATIAKRLVESKTTIPHYQVTVAVAMDALMDLRKQINGQLEAEGVKLSVNDFLVRACAFAMHKHKYVNSSWGSDSKSVQVHGRVNVGVAVALDESKGGGLVVATIRDADRVALRDISSETKRLAKKARDKGLTIDEMSDATFTISNLGMFGVEHFTAIVNPPNSAILAVGAAVHKPVVRDGEIVPGYEMQMTMSSDHRVIDGAMAAAYLSTVKQMLEAPASMLV